MTQLMPLLAAALVALAMAGPAAAFWNPAWDAFIGPWPNGGGMVCPTDGTNTFMQPTAYIDSESRVCGSVHISGEPRIINSTITGGDIGGGAATIRNSIIAGHWENLAIRANAEIVNSIVRGGLISYNAKVIGSEISGNSGAMRIMDNARVINSRLRNEVIEGHAIVRDSETFMGGSQVSVSGTAKVIGSRLYSGAEVSGSAVVKHAVITSNGKVNCGRWVNITVTTDRRSECDRNGKPQRTGDLLSNPPRSRQHRHRGMIPARS